ncbi:MAG: hypothetical protein ACR65T_13505 [Methylocystis sp.]|uniref:hypothetical protein n=1 Tax=Methylocystis sp. TaxID=1911079 RepID=UPI003DA42570
MSDIEVRVIGARPPKRSVSGFTRLRVGISAIARGIFLRPRLMALAGLAAFVVFVGTPHVGWDYECKHPMRGLGSCRSVAWCAYYGFQGRRIVIPENGQSCQLVGFVPVDWTKLVRQLNKRTN